MVYLDANNDGKLDDGEVSFTTGGDGKYQFAVKAGKYAIRVVPKKGYKAVAPGAGIPSA